MLGDLEVCVVVRETVTLTFQVAPQNTPTIKAESSTIMMKQIRMKAVRAPLLPDSRRGDWIKTMMSGR